MVIDAALAKPDKPAPTKNKKLKDEKKLVSSAKTAPDKQTPKKSTTSSGANGSVTITKRKAATTKQTADPPAAAAAASITPPSSAPQASSTSTRPQRRKAAEPISGPSIEPTRTIPSGTKPVEEAIATATSNHSKILSELAAQGSLPLQREEKDSGTEDVRAEEGRQAQREPLCGTLQQEEAQAQAVVGDELQRQEDLARTASASAATQVTLPGRSTQVEGIAAAPAQLEPHSSPAPAITPPPTKAALITTLTPPTQTIPIITMAGPQPPPPQPFRVSPRQARPSEPPAPAAPKPVEELRQWQQKQEQRQRWKPVEPLPVKYKSAARRVTLAMVAGPIAIVTSFALYDRREFFPFPSARCLRS